ncbi:carboxylesterase family protein [Streptomyces sp. NPDC053720]|uniref:carboxylesterase family protein n=1 Tax=Streptomyces sp. NPDC053720 TaxID=3154855 RepID=UPI00344A6A7F
MRQALSAVQPVARISRGCATTAVEPVSPTRASGDEPETEGNGFRLPDEHATHQGPRGVSRSAPGLRWVRRWPCPPARPRCSAPRCRPGPATVRILDPATLVAEQDVVVTVTYRLGLLGFIQSESGPKANLGLLDQREAFHWTRRNISAFGGDPHNVTAFGQSAGAAALVDLMATENTASLFTRAITQSAPLGIMRGRERLNRAVSRRANAIRATTPIAADADVQADVIRAGAPFGLKGGMPIAPQYGYPPLPAEHDVDAAGRKTAPRIDVLIGSTSEEARLFLPVLPGPARWFRMPLLGRILERGIVAFCTWAVYSRGLASSPDDTAGQADG